YFTTDSRHLGGYGAVDSDLHADPLARDDQFRRRSGALRHDHDAQSRHRIMPPASGSDSFRRLRGRKGDHRRGDAQNLAILRRDVRSADAGYVYTSAVSLAPRAGRALI